MECIYPSPAQCDALVELLGLSRDTHATPIEFLGLLGSAHFPGDIPSAVLRLASKDVRKLYVGEPGTEGSATQIYYPHEDLGMTIEVCLEVRNGARSMSVSLYPLEAFEAVVREATQAALNVMVENMIDRTRGAVSPQDLLECLNGALRESELGALFEADRSAARMHDAIETAPARVVRSRVPRG